MKRWPDSKLPAGGECRWMANGRSREKAEFTFFVNGSRRARIHLGVNSKRNADPTAPEQGNRVACDALDSGEEP